MTVPAGCSSETSEEPDPAFDASVYSRTCSVPADCVVVLSGDPCGCSCDQTAIAASERDRLHADSDAYQASHCPEGAAQCGACPQAPMATCTAGACELVP